MVCNKCGELISEEDLFCKKCGARLKGGNMMTKVAGIVLVLAIVTACAVYLFVRAKNGNTLPTISDATPTPTINATETVTAVTETTTATPSASATKEDLEKELNDAISNLEKVEEAASKYMADYEYSDYVTKNGYLYDMSAKDNVVTANLVDTQKLDSKYDNSEIFLLYLRPADFSDYDEVKFTNSLALEVFAAYETKTGVALVSENNSGIIYRENLNRVLANYSTSNGEIKRPTKDDDEYDEILKTVTSYEKSDGDYIIRYLASDDKHAIGVFTIDGMQEIKVYAFEKTDKGFVIAADNLQDEEKPVEAMNKALPNLNVDILPKYSLTGARLEQTLATDTFTSGMLTDGLISEDDMPLVYVSGNNSYVYLKFQSGLIYLLQKSGDSWIPWEVASWVEAEEIMSGMESRPPLYIIWQE